MATAPPPAPDARRLTASAAAHAAAGDWVASVDDARRAVEAEPGLAEAHKLRGIALFQLEEYEAAHASLSRAAALAPTDADAAAWLRKAAAELAPDGVGVGPVVPGKGEGEAGDAGDAGPATPPPPPPVFRHQWFQTPTSLQVDVLAKRLPRDAVSVTIEPRRLAVTVAADEAGGRPRAYALDLPLWAAVDAAASSHAVTPSKVEVKLVKAAPGAWADLTSAGPAAKAAPPTIAAPAPAVAAPAAAADAGPPASARPVYPSSAPRRVDWDALEREAAAEKEEVDGDRGLQAFFQRLYADADDDARRAMVKSYVESGGTNLSTVWKEVGAKRVAMEAPEGMEARTYEK